MIKIETKFGTLLFPLLLSTSSIAFQNPNKTMSGTSSQVNTPGMFSMAFVTVPDMNVAKYIAGGLVREKFAACVNIIPGVTSVYEWENEVNEDPELILMIKTRTSSVNDVIDYVRENHPYDVAEVISSPIDKGNLPYLKWISDIVPGK